MAEDMDWAEAIGKMAPASVLDEGCPKTFNL